MSDAMAARTAEAALFAPRSAQPIVYQIVVSEQLPCFDPSISIKNKLMSKENARKLSRFGLRHKTALIPVYFVGLVLRIVETLVPAHVGEVLAVTSALFQAPSIFFVIMAFRYEYVRVLAHTFEFYFLAATATLWIACTFVYIQDVRAILLSIVWVDFIDLVLIETYFGDSKTMFVIAVTSGLYIMLVTGKLALTYQVRDSKLESLSPQSSQIDSLTIKDALVNTMGTMVMLMIRLAYRKYNIVKNEQRGSSWTQSIGYRCRIALRDTIETASASASAAKMQRALTTRRLPMRYIEIPMLIHADNTVFPWIGSNSELKRWQLAALYACGGVGYALSTFALAASGSLNDTFALGYIIPGAAVVGLLATFVVWYWFVSCSQRQLLIKLCWSFDFIFLYLQLVASHFSMCDMLMWNWVVSCAIWAEFLWMDCFFILDTLTPAMKSRLKLKTWYGVPVLLLHLAKQLIFMGDVLVWQRWKIQNRLLVDLVIGGYEVQFRLFPFLFSRQITILIWCVRILHRIKTRRSDNDLTLLLGNVEYDCQPTSQLHQRLRGIAPEPEAAAAEPQTGEHGDGAARDER